MSVPTISNDGRGASYFGARDVCLTGEVTRRLSEQIGALNFRLRRSVGYSSDFHVAGDPTLLIVLSGIIKIELPTGERREFSKGDLYIAEDYLEDDVAFDPSFHGHRAEMIGDSPYEALHLKLSKRA